MTTQENEQYSKEHTEVGKTKLEKMTAWRLIIFFLGVAALAYVGSYILPILSVVASGCLLCILGILVYVLYKKLFK